MNGKLEKLEDVVEAVRDMAAAGIGSAPTDEARMACMVVGNLLRDPTLADKFRQWREANRTKFRELLALAMHAAELP